MNLNGWRPRQQPRPRIQTIAQRTPATAPQKKSCRSQAQFFDELDRPSATRTKPSSQNAYEKLKTSIATSSSLSRAWRLRASSAYSRDAEGDSFLTCAAKKKTEAVGGEHATMHAVALICSPRLLVCRVFYEMLLFSDLIIFEHNTVRSFPIEPKAVFFHEIESVSSGFIKENRFESMRFELRSSLMRALTTA